MGIPLFQVNYLRQFFEPITPDDAQSLFGITKRTIIDINSSF